ncbi:MAG: YihY/virulence factor BrkB family protein [Planctomycetota bacterium]|nr:YihY/virulence factor BrkB family protein [Planctomycetota bacterium]
MNLVQPLSRYAQRHALVWRSCYVQLRRCHAMTMSAALCYRTIFALIPLLLLALLGLKSMGLVDKGRHYLDDLLTNAGLREIATVDSSASAAAEGSAAGSQPASRGARGRTFNIADIISRQIDRVESKLTFSALGPIGAVLLVWTALGLLVTMEDFLNRIFDVPRGRSWRRRILTYWAVVTLGPLFLSAAVYTWMPNTRVRFPAALAGAAAAVALWVIAKQAFFIYVSRVAHKSLYGAMGALPLFLLWVYLSWAIFLLGAQLTAVLNDPRFLLGSAVRPPLAGPWQRLAATVAVAGRFLDPSAPAPASAAEVAARAHLSEADALHILAQLADRVSAASGCAGPGVGRRIFRPLRPRHRQGPPTRPRPHRPSHEPPDPRRRAGTGFLGPPSPTGVECLRSFKAWSSTTGTPSPEATQECMHEAVRLLPRRDDPRRGRCVRPGHPAGGHGPGRQEPHPRCRRVEKGRHARRRGLRQGHPCGQDARSPGGPGQEAASLRDR